MKHQSEVLNGYKKLTSRIGLRGNLTFISIPRLLVRRRGVDARLTLYWGEDVTEQLRIQAFAGVEMGGVESGGASLDKMGM
mmetsp:Transcript_7161/g.12868  ORF Transcript_7161/g.12868 Transcript_7161/m.12868 type:complete len:81 (-) Transcript_7161:36-278(-)